MQCNRGPLHCLRGDARARRNVGVLLEQLGPVGVDPDVLGNRGSAVLGSDEVSILSGPMRIPNADKAIIAPEKLRDYLLNPAHRRGASKARLLLACGYRAAEWHVLETDLRMQHLVADFAATKTNPYGTRFEISAPLAAPSGRRILVQSVWQIDKGTDLPRLITLYPR